MERARAAGGKEGAGAVGARRPAAPSCLHRRAAATPSHAARRAELPTYALRKLMQSRSVKYITRMEPTTGFSMHIVAGMFPLLALGDSMARRAVWRSRLRDPCSSRRHGRRDALCWRSIAPSAIPGACGCSLLGDRNTAGWKLSARLERGLRSCPGSAMFPSSRPLRWMTAYNHANPLPRPGNCRRVDAPRRRRANTTCSARSSRNARTHWVEAISKSFWTAGPIRFLPRFGTASIGRGDGARLARDAGSLQSQRPARFQDRSALGRCWELPGWLQFRRTIACRDLFIRPSSKS